MVRPANVHFWILVVVSATTLSPVRAGRSGISKQVVFAVNAGGEAHVDVNGITFQKDPLEVGTASDYGRQYLSIGRAPDADAILYQTERYHHSTFGYNVPVLEDGDYVLVLKFCEVYFNAPGMKVFDVTLNNVHTIISYLDIFEKVGKAVAHDEYIPFRISQGTVLVNDEESELIDKTVRVEFIKGSLDNPKVNAIYVMKGYLDDVPMLSSPFSESIEDDDKEEKPVPLKEDIESPPAAKKKWASSSKIPDPYSVNDSSWTLLPIFVTIFAFIPFLFCLCKL